MKTIQKLICAGILMLCFLAGAPGQARAADTFDTLKKILNVVHQANNQVPSGAQVEKAEALIQYLQGGGDPAQWIETAGVDTSILDNPYLDTIVSIYILVEEEDLMGIVGIVVPWLGDDAPCIIADILFPATGGQLCALVKELVELALKIAGMIDEFFSDLAEAAWEALKDAYCASLGHVFGGCDADEGPPPPSPLQQVYDAIYRPERQAGLETVRLYGEAGSKGFNAMKSALRSEAKKKAHSLLSSNWDDAELVAWSAERLYLQQVDADLTGVVMGTGPGSYAKLTAERQQILADWPSHVQQAVASWKNGGYKGDPYAWRSYVELSMSVTTPGYNGVYTWMVWHAGQTLNMQSRSAWFNNFWQDHKDEIISKFMAELQAHLEGICPPDGNRFQCPDCQNVNACLNMMNYFDDRDRSRCRLVPVQDLENQCPADADGQPFCSTPASYDYCLQNLASTHCNTDYASEYSKSRTCRFSAGVANARAVAVCQKMRSMGSRIECQSQIRDSAGDNQPAHLVCTLPVQFESCKQLQDGTVRCDYQEDPNYTALRDKVAEAVGTLNRAPSNTASYGTTHHLQASDQPSAQNMTLLPDACRGDQAKRNGVLAVSDTDPLRVTTGSQCHCELLKNKNASFGFGLPSTQAGFIYDCGKTRRISPNERVDGLTTPHISFAEPQLVQTGGVRQKLEKQRMVKNPVRAAIEKHGPGPITKVQGIQNKIKEPKTKIVGSRSVVVRKRALLQMGIRQYAPNAVIRFQAIHQAGSGVILEFQNRSDTGKAWTTYRPGSRLHVTRMAGGSTCTIVGLTAGLWRVRVRSEAGAQWSTWTTFSVKGPKATRRQITRSKKSPASAGSKTKMPMKVIIKK